jgi:hypothetical protein
MVPNDWGLPGEPSTEEQDQYYKVMFEKTAARDWVKGFGLWDWNALLYPEQEAAENDDYGVYGKPAEQTIKAFYSK